MERVVAALGKVTEIATCGSATPLPLSSSSPSFSHHSVKCISEGQQYELRRHIFGSERRRMMVDDCCPAIWESDTRQGSRPRPTTISLVSHRNSILQLYFRFSKMFNLKFYLMDPNSPHFCKSRAFPMMWLHFALHNKLCPFTRLPFPLFLAFQRFFWAHCVQTVTGCTSECSVIALSPCHSVNHIPPPPSSPSPSRIHHCFDGPTVDVNCQSCKFINI